MEMYCECEEESVNYVNISRLMRARLIEMIEEREREAQEEREKQEEIERQLENYSKQKFAILFTTLGICQSPQAVKVFESIDIDQRPNSGSDDSKKSEQRKLIRKMRHQARKNRSNHARNTLRQMNFIGLDNVTGYSPEVLMKLTPKAQKTFMEKKKSE